MVLLKVAMSCRLRQIGPTERVLAYDSDNGGPSATGTDITDGKLTVGL